MQIEQANVDIPGMAVCALCAYSDRTFLFSREGHFYYRCKKCSLEWIDPVPSPETLSNIYSESYYDAWGGLDNVAAKMTKMKTFADRLSLIPPSFDAPILDCGCAGGFFLEAAQQRGFFPFGIDINEIALTMAQSAVSRDSLFCGSLLDAPFNPGKFYAIFMSDYLEHCHNFLEIIRKSNQLLKVDGYIIISTPNTHSLTRRIMRFEWFHYKTEHLVYFNRKNIVLLLEKNGFTIMQIKPARKALTINYIYSILKAYPRAGLGAVFALLRQLLPSTLLDKPIWFTGGEMVVVARKNST